MKKQQTHQRCRFTKSYKYKHKLTTSARRRRLQIKPSSCDQAAAAAAIELAPQVSTNFLLTFKVAILMLLLLLLLPLPGQVSTISIVPMTLNPMLKRLTLNQLPMSELSNSLSVYPQLQYLDLSANQLRQIKYENFNFKSAPNSLLLHHHQPSTTQHHQQQQQSKQAAANNNQELNVNNELLASRLKHSLDRSHSDGGGGGGEGELRLHLRELYLDENRIEQLGDSNGLGATNDLFSSQDDADQATGDAAADYLSSEQQSTRLKSADLERLAPFLTLVRLEALSLAGNRLAQLQRHTFLGLVQLKQLDLSRNQLEFIDRYAFVGLIELRHLSLAHNKLARHLSHLGTVFCRAPTVELRSLDLNDQAHHHHYRARQSGESAAAPESAVVLPNQMFLCAPKLTHLRLDGLQLRYIQVNAFDNLHNLELLNLSRNYLEQVPSDSLGSSYSLGASNVSLSLRQLDLSDNLIEFVSAGSFGWLRNLQRLCMNSMKRLVSFDLASLSIHQLAKTDRFDEEDGNIEQLIKSDGKFKSALKQLLPDHLFARVSAQPSTTDETIINQAQQPQQQQQQHQQFPLINEQLIELQLRNNHRLQSVHSSLSLRDELPRGKVRFRRLQLIDLGGASELRELNLEQMLDLDAPESPEGFPVNPLDNHLHIDLSSSSASGSLNCSSCQMSWLLDAARAELANRRRMFVQQSAAAAQIWLPNLTPPGSAANTKIVLLSVDSIRCASPLELPLTQLVELEVNGAFAGSSILSHCQAGLSVQQWSASDQTVAVPRRSQDELLAVDSSKGSSWTTRTGSSSSSELLGQLLGLCLLVSLLMVVGKLALILADRARQRRLGAGGVESFKWLRANAPEPPGPPSSSSSCSAHNTTQVHLYEKARDVSNNHRLIFLDSSNSSSSGSSGGSGCKLAPAFNSNSNNNVGQIERASAPANLFSRFARRWRGYTNFQWQLVRPTPSQPPLRRTNLQKEGDYLFSTAVASSAVREDRQQQQQQRDLTAANQAPLVVGAKSSRLALHVVGDCNFIKAPSSMVVGAQGRGSSMEFVYANCEVANTTSKFQAIESHRADLSSFSTSSQPPPATCLSLAGTYLHQQKHLQQQQQQQQTPTASSAANSRLAARPGERELEDTYVLDSAAQTTSNNNHHHDTGGLDSHIYVTLDRPIKQQQQQPSDKCVALASSQQQQQQQHRQWKLDRRQQAATASADLAHEQRPQPPDDYKSFEWPSPLSRAPAQPEESASRWLNDVGDDQDQHAAAWRPLKVEDKFKLVCSARELQLDNHRLQEQQAPAEQFASPSNKLSSTVVVVESLYDRHRGRRRSSAAASQQSPVVSYRATFDKNAPTASESAPSNRKQQLDGAQPRGGNVTGHSDDFGETARAAAADCLAGRRQLFMGLNGSCETVAAANSIQLDTGGGLDCSSRAARNKYDANHDAASSPDSNMVPTAALCDDDYVINGLDCRPTTGWTAVRSPGGQRQLMGGAPAPDEQLGDAPGNHNKAASDHRLIGQQNCVASALNSLPLTELDDDYDGEPAAGSDLGELAEQVVGVQQRRRLLTGARHLPTSSVVIEQSKLRAADQQQQQQHRDHNNTNNHQLEFCDSSNNISQRHKQPFAVPGETIITQQRSFRQLQKIAERTSKTMSRVTKQHNGTNEIYSNQFYYCKPSQATLSNSTNTSTTTTKRS